MKYRSALISFLAGCLLLCACRHDEKSRPLTGVHYELPASMAGRPLLLISCLRCGCFNTELNAIYHHQPDLLQQYTIVADSGCAAALDFRQLITYRPQAFIDSVYEDNYNLVLVHPQGGARLVETAESEKLAEIMSAFPGSGP